MNKPKQLIFPFQINQKASFESFFCSPDNLNLIARLSEILISEDAHELIIHGEEGAGKSFLMQAICNELSSSEKQFAFIPMKKLSIWALKYLRIWLLWMQFVLMIFNFCFQIKIGKQRFFNLINECQQSNCSLILSFGGTHPLEEKN